MKCLLLSLILLTGCNLASMPIHSTSRTINNYAAPAPDPHIYLNHINSWQPDINTILPATPTYNYPMAPQL